MKLSEQSFSPSLRIEAYDARGILVGGEWLQGPLLLGPAGVQSWSLPAGFAPDATSMAAVLALRPALVLLGTGERQRFPAAPVLRPLVEAGIGCEVMDTGAACRTFNLLLAEGRNVVAALLPLTGVLA